MAFTNYGNGYKFEAIQGRRSHIRTVSVQRMRNDGTWGKPTEERTFGDETPEQVVARLIKNNNRAFRLAE